jgi:hypothetical protein
MTPEKNLETLFFARLCGIGQVNSNNARGKGNRAARRAGWYVRPTGGPLLVKELAELRASI